MRKTLVLFLFTLSSIFFLFPTNAYAHAQLISTNPMPNSVQDKTPDKLILEFGEQMLDFEKGNSITVLAPSGKEITTGDSILNGAIIYRNLLKTSETGVFKVSYRAISNDGHKVTGEFTFDIIAINKEISTVKPNPIATPSQSKSPELFTDIEIAKNDFSISHFWHLHEGHIYLTVFGLILLAGWAIFRRLN